MKEKMKETKKERRKDALNRKVYGLDRASYNQGANAQFSFSIYEDMQPTLTSRGPGAVCAPCAIDYGGGHQIAGTLAHRDDKGLCNEWMHEARIIYEEKAMTDTVGTLCARGYPDKLTNQDVLSGIDPITPYEREDNTMAIKRAVRRLTPQECTRLQGFPDGWCDIGEWVDSAGKKHKDADGTKYKALGNSIAEPYWHFLFAGMSEELQLDGVDKPTLGSLFDGIGGFPRVHEMINGKGTARWASEIEEFPIAVTKRHFPEE